MKILAMTCICADVFPESGKILPGGNALNFAVNCKAAGVKHVYLMGNIGTDSYGRIVKRAMDKYNIDRSRVYEKDGHTANHTIHIDAKGDRYFKDGAWISGVWADYRIRPSDKLFMRDMDIVATTLYEPIFEDIVSVRRSSSFLLSVDFHDEEISAKWEKYFDAVDFFFISAKNRRFSKELKEWSERFNTVFTATLGEYGSVSYKNGREYTRKAVTTAGIADTTGCGDSYQAGFVAEYARGKDIKAAMLKGSECAAKTLSYTGGFEF